MWSVQEAKARLSEVMRRARAGEPQVIGSRDPCVVVSAKSLPKQNSHLGRFLIESAPKGAALETPSRASRRGNPFDST